MCHLYLMTHAGQKPCTKITLSVKTNTAFSCTQMLVVSDDVQSTGSSLDRLSGHICLGDIDIICKLKYQLRFDYSNPQTFCSELIQERQALKQLLR